MPLPRPAAGRPPRRSAPPPAAAGLQVARRVRERNVAVRASEAALVPAGAARLLYACIPTAAASSNASSLQQPQCRTGQGELGQSHERICSRLGMLWEVVHVAGQQPRRQPAAALGACAEVGRRGSAGCSRVDGGVLGLRASGDDSSGGSAARRCICGHGPTPNLPPPHPAHPARLAAGAGRAARGEGRPAGRRRARQRRHRPPPALAAAPPGTPPGPRGPGRPAAAWPGPARPLGASRPCACRLRAALGSWGARPSRRRSNSTGLAVAGHHSV